MDIAGSGLASPTPRACGSPVLLGRTESLLKPKQLPSTPGAPQRACRRRRRAAMEEEEDEMAFAALAARLTSIRLQEPPAKRRCMQSTSSSDWTIGRSEPLADAGVAAVPAPARAPEVCAGLQTPPRRTGQSRAKADDASPTESLRWASVRSSPSDDCQGRPRSPSSSLSSPDLECEDVADSVPWASDPGFLLYGAQGQRDTGTPQDGDDFRALNALASLFANSTGCSRLLSFED
eukprot:TRINITY_DN22915_c0_g1_i1.p1 TRINITY_DN22915_c0_g1~~TRINITY_DN22915_c0_g1_i1.p1  ORF type:complete len:252 (+),score=38.41 TRINITY_DN22915_c0_g1_i1:53-757(+)